MSTITTPDVCNFIAARFQARQRLEAQPVLEPASGEVIVRVPLSDRSDVARAANTLRAAFPDSAATPVTCRAQILFAYGDLHATGKDSARFFTEKRIEVSRWHADAAATLVDDSYQSGLRQQ
jgi:acyl-CoA reductase-like NAD-dependent aldehyde dehydrogenase